MTEEEKIRHCTAALRTADIIFELVQSFKERLFWAEHREDAPNPLHQQMVKGLLLEFWGPRPVSIITPWGKYSFSGWYAFSSKVEAEREIWTELMPSLREWLGLDLYKPKSKINIETIHGDLFAIGVKSSDIFLPDPEECVYSDYISFNLARKEWLELMKQVKYSVSP